MVAHTSCVSPPMDPDSPDYEALLAALRRNGWIPFRFFCFGNWYLEVEKSWSEYLRDREGALRSTIRRMNRKFAAEGGIPEIVTHPDSAEPAIQAFNDVHALSWKGRSRIPNSFPA
ncbi:MAG: hypothetical protein IPK39_23705 [Sulfuritalea sp.]|nr:hypothetical protein [Sulfuritalea sp.]